MPPAQNSQNPYEFIMNPQQPQRRNPLAGGSLPTRIAIVGAGVVLLLFIFVFIRGLLSSGGDSIPAIVSVAQRQQEIVRLTSVAATQPSISSENKSVAVTANVALGSAQSELVGYLATQGRQVKPKELALKRSAATDEQLTAALAATTYNSVFPEVLKTQLTLYEQDLQRAYGKTSGKNGRAILDKQFKDARLLTEKLNASLPSNR